MSAAPTVGSSSHVYEALESYNWDDDVEFQAGLTAILGSNSTPEQATELTLRARCFYYARKFNTPVDFDTYKAHRLTHPSHPSPPAHSTLPNGAQAPEPAGGILPSSDANEPPAPYPTSFAHIVNLVTTGQPIPGIKEIPNTVLTGQGTEPAKARRKKPWEKDEQGPGQEQVQTAGEATSS
ncbi:hypothetical protein K491DRAFT_648563 [Lophiostoma macrostomum CBS 122681]|uniref:Uncharacterized protein n=1 Tax=Lophiostoma macrostomum CBS 122681 TaxID=1314788 RepID=A0A6A6TLW3_9PLEO|nr:hypothetical protein K491DRAFT_648563 [Lophiostoma macrostomum CBS 122681]